MIRSSNGAARVGSLRRVLATAANSALLAAVARDGHLNAGIRGIRERCVHVENGRDEELREQQCLAKAQSQWLR
ncbi:hypothetical protein GCM10020219_078180 [Nonomuraea dietziae]